MLQGFESGPKVHCPRTVADASFILVEGKSIAKIRFAPLCVGFSCLVCLDSQFELRYPYYWSLAPKFGTKTCKVCFRVRTRCNTREDNVIGFAIRVVVFVFLKPGSEVWNRARVKFVSMCEPDAIGESIMCLGERFWFVIAIFLKPGSEI